MPSLLEISPRVSAASALFEDNASLTGVYVCADGQGFTREGVASAHAKEVSGDYTDYNFIEPGDVEIVSNITDCASAAEVDTVIDEVGDTVKGVVLRAADAWKASLTEIERVTAKKAFVETCEDVSTLELLLHGEEDEDVITAINTRIDSL